MKFKKIELKTYLVEAICPECGGGMKSTGVVLNTYPAQYPHKCENCEYKANSHFCYPLHEYDVLEEERKD